MEVSLYSAKGSNSSERVEWVLNFKSLRYNRIEVSSAELSTTYLDINPFGYVPSLRVDDALFSESILLLSIWKNDFLDQAYLAKALMKKRTSAEFVDT